MSDEPRTVEGERRLLRASSRVERTAPALIDLIGRACQARRQAGGRLFPLAQAVPDFPPPPHVREALRVALERDSTHRYTVDPGIPELRRAIARVLGGTRGASWDADEQILVTAGANLAFAEVLPALVDPGDEVLLLSPYYLNHGMAVELAGAHGVEAPLDPERGFAPDFDALERTITPRTRALVLVNPANPTGTVLGRADVGRLLQFAAAHELWVVSDETYEDFVLETPADGWASAASFTEHAGRVVVLGSFSKWAGLSGWRVGWIAGPAELVHELLKCHDTMIICAPVAGQLGALAALEGDRSWLETQRETLRGRRRVALDALGASGELSTPAGASRGAMFVLFRPRAGLLPSSTATALDVIAKTGVALVPGAAFGRAGEGWLRLSYAAVGELERAEALSALDAYITSFPRGVAS
jgi:aspartate/methionine/tyrosine aminotransferase